MIDRKRCLPSGRWLDRGFMGLSVLCAWLPLVVMAGFFLQLLVSSLPVWREFGLSFIWSTEWDPVANHYGAFNALAGTVVTTVIGRLAHLVQSAAAENIRSCAHSDIRMPRDIFQGDCHILLTPFGESFH